MFNDGSLISEESVIEGVQAIPPQDFSDFMVESAFEGYKIGKPINRDYGLLDSSSVQGYFDEFFVASNL